MAPPKNDFSEIPAMAVREKEGGKEVSMDDLKERNEL
jgi:hypothetical protein